MHTQKLDAWRHEHVFLGSRHTENERRTWFVVGLTATMMVVEIVGGTIFGSMALVADGWHMSTHAGALALAALAYRFSRRHAHNEYFAFGTGKIGELAGFSSAIILAIIAVLIGSSRRAQSLDTRNLHPRLEGSYPRDGKRNLTVVASLVHPGRARNSCPVVAGNAGA